MMGHDINLNFLIKFKSPWCVDRVGEDDSYDVWIRTLNSQAISLSEYRQAYGCGV